MQGNERNDSAQLHCHNATHTSLLFKINKEKPLNCLVWGFKAEEKLEAKMKEGKLLSINHTYKRRVPLTTQNKACHHHHHHDASEFS